MPAHPQYTKGRPSQLNVHLKWFNSMTRAKRYVKIQNKTGSGPYQERQARVDVTKRKLVCHTNKGHNSGYEHACSLVKFCFINELFLISVKCIHVLLPCYVWEISKVPTFSCKLNTKMSYGSSVRYHLTGQSIPNELNMTPYLTTLY